MGSTYTKGVVTLEYTHRLQPSLRRACIALLGSMVAATALSCADDSSGPGNAPAGTGGAGEARSADAEDGVALEPPAFDARSEATPVARDAELDQSALDHRNGDGRPRDEATAPGDAARGGDGTAREASSGANDAAMTNADYDVYLLAGQSNMDGRGLVKDLTTAQRAPLDGVLIAYRFLPFAGDARAFATDGFAALVPGFSVAPNYAGTLPSPTFGPEIGFATDMRQQQPTQKLALVKGSRGGTTLYGDWKPGTQGQPATQGACYREYLETLTSAKAALAQAGRSYVIRGLLWHQGESDAGTAAASTYGAMLSTFIARIREDVGDPNLPIAVGEVYEDGTRAPIRSAQKQVATSTAHVAFVSVDGLVTLDSGTHFDAPSQLTLGKRFAQTMSALTSAR